MPVTWLILFLFISFGKAEHFEYVLPFMARQNILSMFWGALRPSHPIADEVISFESSVESFDCSEQSDRFYIFEED